MVLISNVWKDASSVPILILVTIAILLPNAAIQHVNYVPTKLNVYHAMPIILSIPKQIFVWLRIVALSHPAWLVLEMFVLFAKSVISWITTPNNVEHVAPIVRNVHLLQNVLIVLVDITWTFRRVMVVVSHVLIIVMFVLIRRHVLCVYLDMLLLIMYVSLVFPIVNIVLHWLIVLCVWLDISWIILVNVLHVILTVRLVPILVIIVVVASLEPNYWIINVWLVVNISPIVNHVNRLMHL